MQSSNKGFANVTNLDSMCCSVLSNRFCWTAGIILTRY